MIGRFTGIARRVGNASAVLRMLQARAVTALRVSAGESPRRTAAAAKNYAQNGLKTISHKTIAGMM